MHTRLNGRLFFLFPIGIKTWLSTLLPYDSDENSQVELSITPHNVPTDAGGVEWIRSEGSIAQKKVASGEVGKRQNE
ncbi:hypothetical protein PEBR_16790 [Penicillium brasilianum]|uniref:Uncharacterized protein n=1 Tax=Penicillium brasilianum TaxID=104259 RepID=A0A1S9RUJ1_PENBI|nr:hypothetical protein PEBR_16790 [Penicillium brasilianum]